jgi:phosphoglycolate phosphatase
MPLATAAPPDPPQALLFDWDNTLVDSWGTMHYAWNVTLAAMGHPSWTLDEAKERVRHSLRDTFPLLFGARWEEARQLYLDAYTAVHLERLKALPGAAALVQELAGEGFYLAVVSNKTGRVLRREAESLGWTRHFARLVGATDAVADKPDLAPVELALDGSGIARGPAVWFIGDTGLDMQCAIGAGCVPVLVGAADPDEADLRRWRPVLTFSDCAGLGSYLKGLRSKPGEPTC